MIKETVWPPVFHGSLLPTAMIPIAIGTDSPYVNPYHREPQIAGRLIYISFDTFATLDAHKMSLPFAGCRLNLVV